MAYQLLHTLSAPGMPFERVVVKVLGEPTAVSATSSEYGGGDQALQRKDKAGRAKGFSRVLVGDESASIYLTFRTTRQADVKRGRFLEITGTVTCHLGSLHLLAGPRPHDLLLLKHGVSMGPMLPAALPNLSRVVHHVGTLVVRPLAAGRNEDGPPFVLEYGLLSDGTAPRRTLYVGTSLPQSHYESFPAAAHRALEEVLGSEVDEGEGAGGATTLVSGSILPVITEFQRSADATTHAYHFYLGLQPPSAPLLDGEDQSDDGGDDDEDEGGVAFVWRTHDQLRAAAKARQKREIVRHVLPLVNKARHALEEAVRHGALRGQGWDELHRYLVGDEEEGQGHTHATDHDKVSALLTEAKKTATVAAAAGERGRPEVLPVTVLSGFLGSGKTTLLKHILEQQTGMKVAVLVNDMAAVNIDAALVMQAEHTEAVLELTNGCICCTLREDLLEQIVELAQAQKYDYLLIEASGISEPLPIAETFSFTDAKGNAVSEIARLDTTVTVVDAAAVRANLSRVERAASCRGEREHEADGSGSSSGEDDKTLADLWVEQIEFADTVVLNKVDLLPNGEAELAALSALVRKLNPGARIVPASFGRVDLGAVVHTGSFSLDKAQSAPGWLKELRGEHVPETEEYGVTSFVYKRTRPFHPGRLHALIQQGTTEAPAVDVPLAGLVRVKGYVWLATRMSHMVFWSLAGTVGHSLCASPHDRWLAATDPTQWPEGLDLSKAAASWQPLWGDRRCEVVFIGCGVDRGIMEAALDACLLTEAEMALGPVGWRKRFDDPFFPDFGEGDDGSEGHWSGDEMEESSEDEDEDEDEN